MPKINELCKYCGLPAIEKSTKKLSDVSTLIRLQCGHSYVRTVNHAVYDIESIDNKTLFPFQKEGIRFVEDSGFRCLIADEMGLGKTVQYLGALKLHPEQMPALFIVKSGLRRQLEKELYRWTGEMLMQTIDSSSQKVFPFPTYTIISYDTLARMKNLEVFSYIKTVVLDECQYIKNEEAQRTKNVRLLIIKNKIKHVIGVSGTPIKNRPDEFFPILNMLAPHLFPTKDLMLRRYFDYSLPDAYGKVEIKEARPEFYEALKTIMIRRERAVVAPELPSINRMFFNSEIENKELKKSYTQVQKEFEEFYNEAVLEGKDHGAEFSASLLGFFARMRKLTGIAKTQPVVEFTTDFLMSTDRKLVIFGHHKETLKNLSEILDTWCLDGGWNPTLKLSSDLNADQREEIVTKFKDDARSRILIASTLASGEGLNLQFCSDAIMMERQWNPANEEQAETRFTRFGSNASQVNVTYMISVGTIDEWLTELVEKKRALIGNVVDGKTNAWEDMNLIKELASVVAIKGGKKWTY